MARTPISESSISSSRIAAGTLAALLMTLVTFAAPEAAEATDVLPDNATFARSGIGWDCMMGFRRTGNDCARVAVPANAYLDASGDQWRCNRGYRRTDDRCAAVKVPPNAYLDDSFGNGWRASAGIARRRADARPSKSPRQRLISKR